jgi:hypothetical protein
MAWTLPEGWTEIPDNPPMRLHTFSAADDDGPVEVAISRFPGEVGGVLANINRWRSQVGLSPLDQSQLPAHIERFENTGVEGYFAHIQGEDQHMLAAGLFEPAQQRTWFVRVTLSPAASARLKDTVAAFARSFSAAPAPGGTP